MSNLCFFEISSNFTSIHIVGKRHKINAKILGILPMRKTVKLAQYQVATVGTLVVLLYHIGSSQSSTYHRARSTSYTWGVIHYHFFLIYTHRDYVKIIKFIVWNSFYAVLHKCLGVLVNLKYLKNEV